MTTAWRLALAALLALRPERGRPHRRQRRGDHVPAGWRAAARAASPCRRARRCRVRMAGTTRRTPWVRRCWPCRSSRSAGRSPGATGLRDERADLAVRAVTSFFNAIVTAILLAAFYLVLRGFRVRARPAIVATFLLGFTTPVWVYAKSFMAEPLEALGLLLSLAGAARAGADPPRERTARRMDRRGRRVSRGLGQAERAAARAGLPAAAGLARRRAWVPPALGIAAALAGHATYNLARFGTRCRAAMARRPPRRVHDAVRRGAVRPAAVLGQGRAVVRARRSRRALGRRRDAAFAPAQRRGPPGDTSGAPPARCSLPGPSRCSVRPFPALGG